MRLEREGLVITMPRQGYRVSPISLSDVQDMFYLRAALERACMEPIVRQADDAQLATLDQFRHFDAQDWDGSFVAYNRAFHCRLADISTNIRMRDQLCDLIDQMERAVLISMGSLEKTGNVQMAVDDHCRIIDPLQGRHVNQAERLAKQHISAARKRVTSAISKMFIAG
jgi:DNA-binding GntR family transcriptional regulator